MPGRAAILDAGYPDEYKSGMHGDAPTPSIDVAFLTRWSPARWMLVGLLVVAALVITSPLIYALDYVSWPGVLYAAAILLAFFAGCYLAGMVNGRTDLTPRPFQLPLDRYISITIAIGILGIFARIYDRFILRGFTVEETYELTRESVAANVSVFGYLGGAGFSFGLITLCLVWLAPKDRRRPVAYTLAVLLTAYPIFEALLQGSRSTILQTAFLAFFLARATGALSWLVRSKLAMAAGTVAMLIFFQIIFEIRSLEGGGYEETISEVYRLSGMAQFADAPTWITNAIIATDGQGIIAGLLKAFVHFEQYVTHAWVVYFANVSYLEDGVFGWGRFHFSMPMRFLSKVMGEDLTYNAYIHGMIEGLFSTALSPIYYDFGGLGPLISGLFGFATTRVQALAIVLPERWLPLYAWLCFSCLMVLVENPLIGGLGAFAIYGCIIYVILHSLIAVFSRRTFVLQAAG